MSTHNGATVLNNNLPQYNLRKQNIVGLGQAIKKKIVSIPARPLKTAQPDFFFNLKRGKTCENDPGMAS